MSALETAAWIAVSALCMLVIAWDAWRDEQRAESEDDMAMRQVDMSEQPGSYEP